MKLNFKICNFSTELAVGTLFFLALITLAYFTVILSTENWFQPEYKQVVCFEKVGGLLKGDHVLARGVRVGAIKDISLDEKGVLVHLALTEDITFREGYSVTIRPGTILGGQYVAIDPGPPAAPRIEDDALLEGAEPADLMVEAAEMVQEMRTEIDNIRTALEEGRTIENVVSIIDNLESVSDDLRSGRGLIGRLLTDEDLYLEFKDGLDTLREAGGKTAAAADQAELVLRDIREGKGTLGKLATDEALYNDLQKITGGLRRGQGTIGRLLTEDEVHENILTVTANIRALTDQIDPEGSSAALFFQDDGELFNSLNQSFHSIAEVSENLAQGEGTIGKLIRDDEMYEEAMEIVRELRSALQDFREQSTISTFGSFIFGAF